MANLLEIFNRGAGWLWLKCIEPKSTNEDIRRREFILNIILSSSIFLLLILDSVILYDSVTMRENYRGISFPAFSSIIMAFGLLLALSRKGQSVLASYLLVAIYFVSVSYSSYRWGIELPILLLSYSLVIIIASILVSTKFGFLITFLCAATIVTLGFLETTHNISPDLTWKTSSLRLGNAVEFASILFLTMVISWLSNREIEKSLGRARTSEEALRQERDLLEIKVEQRTMELKQLQVERISQLYRFAEFGRLASGLFHDLINPLAALSLHVDKLIQQPNIRANETKQYLERAVNLTKRMDNFMRGVSKQIQNRELNLLFSPSEEIEQVVQILDYKARRAGVRLVCRIPDQPIQNFGNPLKFHQLIANLVSNAIDAYESIKPSSFQTRTVTISLAQCDNETCIVVTDQGAGMAPELVDKIFEPFFTTKHPHKGTGIGLSTTKDIVEKHFGGRISVASEVAKGTSFTIKFPKRASSISKIGS